MTSSPPSGRHSETLRYPQRREKMKRGHNMKKNFEKLGFYPADILLPKDADPLLAFMDVRFHR